MTDEPLYIHEIYASIQGESTFAGLPCTFVRTSGCNLRCRWCDTTEAFARGQRLSRRQVFEQALAHGTALITITGGEPLLQSAVLPLMADLCDAGRTVLLETSGERDISVVDPRVHRIMDLKAPSSGENARNRTDNLAHLGPGDELKFVLADRDDYQWMCGIIAEHRLEESAVVLLASCVFGQLAPRKLVAWIMEDGIAIRVQLQLHKYVWPPDQRGV